MECILLPLFEGTTTGLPLTIVGNRNSQVKVVKRVGAFKPSGAFRGLEHLLSTKPAIAWHVGTAAGGFECLM